MFLPLLLHSVALLRGANSLSPFGIEKSLIGQRITCSPALRKNVQVHFCFVQTFVIFSKKYNHGNIEGQDISPQLRSLLSMPWKQGFPDGTSPTINESLEK